MLKRRINLGERILSAPDIYVTAHYNHFGRTTSAVSQPFISNLLFCRFLSFSSYDEFSIFLPFFHPVKTLGTSGYPCDSKTISSCYYYLRLRLITEMNRFLCFFFSSGKQSSGGMLLSVAHEQFSETHAQDSLVLSLAPSRNSTFFFEKKGKRKEGKSHTTSAVNIK